MRNKFIPNTLMNVYEKREANKGSQNKIGFGESNTSLIFNYIFGAQIFIYISLEIRFNTNKQWVKNSVNKQSFFNKSEYFVTYYQNLNQIN